MTSRKICSLTQLNLQGRKPKTALISPFSFEALGIRYVSGSIRKAGFDCIEIYYEDFKRNHFEYPGEKELDGLIKLLDEKGVDVVGISVRSSYRKLAALITEEINNKLGIPVIWGSVHPTICPDDSIKAADAICRGEGETPMVELLNAVERGEDVTTVKGFWFNLPDGKVVKNEMEPYVDVNSINNPEYCTGDQHYFQDSVYHKGDPQTRDNSVSVMASRGCAHDCSYCSNKFFLDANSGYLRIRKVDSVIAEITGAMKAMPHIKHIRFFDDLFACNKKWTDEFVEKYKKHVNMRFDCLLHPNQVSDSLIKKLKYAGLSVVEMGIQHGSQRFANEVYGRRVTNEKVLEATRILKKYGIRGNYDLIIDNPLETDRDRQENLEFLLKIPRPYQLFIYSLTHLPGTSLTAKLLSKGLIKPGDVEGESDHSLYQWDVSLTYGRSPEDRFWLALLSLLTKTFVPRGFVKLLYGLRFLRRYPAPLVVFAWCANIIKLAGLAWKRLKEGTLTVQVIRRHVNLKQLPIK